MTSSVSTQTEPAKQVQPQTPGPIVSLTVAAAEQILKLIEADGASPSTMLRLSVTGGGCAGFSYNFSFETETHADDHVFEKNGAKLIVDITSLDYLAGSEVDYFEDLMGASFQIKNPLARSSCGCGSSFFSLSDCRLRRFYL